MPDHDEKLTSPTAREAMNRRWPCMHGRPGVWNAWLYIYI